MEDAFLDAILGAPADEGLRLKYAHWLDGRADPRGQYLRAEIETFRTTRGEFEANADRELSLASHKPVG